MQTILKPAPVSVGLGRCNQPSTAQHSRWKTDVFLHIELYKYSSYSPCDKGQPAVQACALCRVWDLLMVGNGFWGAVLFGPGPHRLPRNQTPFGNSISSVITRA